MKTEEIYCLFNVDFTRNSESARFAGKTSNAVHYEMRFGYDVCHFPNGLLIVSDLKIDRFHVAGFQAASLSSRSLMSMGHSQRLNFHRKAVVKMEPFSLMAR